MCVASFFSSPLCYMPSRVRSWISSFMEVKPASALFLKEFFLHSTCPLSTLTCTFQACALHLKIKTKAADCGSPQHNDTHTHTIPSSVLERSKKKKIETLSLLSKRLLVTNERSIGKYISKRQSTVIKKVMRVQIWGLMLSFTGQGNKASLKPSLIKACFQCPILQ